MSDGAVVDEGFLRRYRELLDAEDEAFDDLEHAYEDGNRAVFDSDIDQWRSSVARRLTFLERHGVANRESPATSGAS